MARDDPLQQTTPSFVSLLCCRAAGARPLTPLKDNIRTYDPCIKCVTETFLIDQRQGPHLIKKTRLPETRLRKRKSYFRVKARLLVPRLAFITQPSNDHQAARVMAVPADFMKTRVPFSITLYCNEKTSTGMPSPCTTFNWMFHGLRRCPSPTQSCLSSAGYFYRTDSHTAPNVCNPVQRRPNILMWTLSLSFIETHPPTHSPQPPPPQAHILTRTGMRGRANSQASSKPNSRDALKSSSATSLSASLQLARWN